MLILLNFQTISIKEWLTRKMNNRKKGEDGILMVGLARSAFRFHMCITKVNLMVDFNVKDSSRFSVEPDPKKIFKHVLLVQDVMSIFI